MKRFWLLLLVIFLFEHHGIACTTAIVSGKATPDGRPILWKHRDSDHFNNKMMFFKGWKYSFIGLINSDDSLQVWGGTNSAGFSIMNSASYNLKATDDKTVFQDQEGVLMKLALSRCATVEEFRELLDSLPKPLGVEANFGVIDAIGGAAYFETNNFSYKIFDANDPNCAPDGYLIRTNYSMSGRENEGAGYNRYNTATSLLAEAYQAKEITTDFFLTKATLSLRHELTQTDLADIFKKKEEFQNRLYPFRDYIVRYSSSSTVVVHGVKPGESPAMVTTWIKIGFQPASISIPLWVSAGEKLPPLLTAPEKKNSLLCTFTLLLKKECFPFQKGTEGESYIFLEKLGNNRNDGFMQVNVEMEKEILARTNKLVAKWRKDGFNEEDARDFYGEMDKSIIDYYSILCDHANK
ncbi:MAG TPA: hypothetical protein DIW31_07960 [Bacteroidales bacterium]|nr:hypothetical protein [Bacteroidales bacterium]